MHELRYSDSPSNRLPTHSEAVSTLHVIGLATASGNGLRDAMPTSS